MPAGDRSLLLPVACESDRLRPRTLRTLFLAACAVLLVGPAPASALAQAPPASVPKLATVTGQTAIVDDDGCRAHTLPRSNDGSTPIVDLPFTIDFFGEQRSALFVNTNGNVTFDHPLAAPWAYGLDQTKSEVIAPFLADVDTRNPGSAQVTYGTTTFQGRETFCVLWGGSGPVGYFDGRIDKLNRFELLLVKRGDQDAGDFDIVFNYERIEWDTADVPPIDRVTSIGGPSARAGFSNGSVPRERQSRAAFLTSMELAGSGQSGAFLERGPSSLSANSRGTLTPGRYIFEVRNGSTPTGGNLVGDVKDELDAALPGSLVQACPTPLTGRTCPVTRANASGHFTFSGLASGSYLLTGWPAANDRLHTRATAGPVQLLESQTASQNIVLGSIAALPGGSFVDSAIGTADGVPVIHWNEPLRLRTTACTAGSAHYTVTVGEQVVRDGDMTRGAPTGAPPNEQAPYTAEAAAVYPLHGTARISFTISGCPNQGAVSFDIYIDPSGRVVTARDGLPIAGATVLLVRSDSAAGPFEMVPDGSDIMSPSNRSNPDSTDASGSFGWDVLAGFYQVRASKQGCGPVSENARSADRRAYPGEFPGGYATTPVLQIPPPALNLEIRLNCGGPHASASTTALAFAETAVGATSDAKTFDIENTGAERLHLQLPLTTSTGDKTDFTVSSACPAAIEPGASCSTTVRFTPTSPTGTARASKIVFDGDGDGAIPSIGLTATTPPPAAGNTPPPASATTPPAAHDGTPRPSAATAKLQAGLVKAVTLASRKRVVTFTCRLAMVGKAKYCRISLGKLGLGSSARSKVTVTRTAPFSHAKATVTLKLSAATLRKLRRAAPRGLACVVTIEALDGSSKPLATMRKSTRLRLAAGRR